MTNQHRLTDEMCEQIGFNCQYSGDIGDTVFSHNDMRRAADWQLDQVKNIVENKIKEMHKKGYKSGCVDLVYRAEVIEEFFQDIMPELNTQENN